MKVLASTLLITAVPALADIKPREESNPGNSKILPIDSGKVITATVAETAPAREEIPSDRPDNGDSIVAAEAVGETLIAGGSDGRRRRTGGSK
jgi:hypothetical protein